MPALRRSLLSQFAVYGLAALLSLPAGNGLLFWYWLLPLAAGQPLLRFVLLAVHRGFRADLPALALPACSAPSAV